jgi:hypothetical protein
MENVLSVVKTALSEKGFTGRNQKNRWKDTLIYRLLSVMTTVMFNKYYISFLKQAVLLWCWIYEWKEYVIRNKDIRHKIVPLNQTLKGGWQPSFYFLPSHDTTKVVWLQRGVGPHWFPKALRNEYFLAYFLSFF